MLGEDMHSFSEMKMFCVTLFPDLSTLNKKRLRLAIDSSEEKPEHFNFILTQALNSVLWDIPEAVDLGFQTFLKQSVVERLEALEYHDANLNDCSENCKICMLK